jgi:hypothetical protein
MAEIEMIWRRRPNPLTLAVVEAFRMKAQVLRKAS